MLATVRRRLTFANVIALIALFVSLGGGVYAASKINGKQIKKASIAGNKLKPEGVTGKQVKESTLGQVPSADNAQTLNGAGPGSFVSAADVRRFRFDETVSSGSVSRSILQVGPLELTGSCTVFGFAIRASTSAANAGFDVGYVQGSNAVSNGGFLGATPEVIVGAGGPGSRRMVGNFVYNDPATTITVPFAAFYGDGNGTRCFFTGTATRGTG